MKDTQRKKIDLLSNPPNESDSLKWNKSFSLSSSNWRETIEALEEKYSNNNDNMNIGVGKIAEQFTEALTMPITR